MKQLTNDPLYKHYQNMDAFIEKQRKRQINILIIMLFILVCIVGVKNYMESNVSYNNEVLNPIESLKLKGDIKEQQQKEQIYINGLIKE